jgi:2,4-dienoyl-CoA reductase-like NADH-dependent reductase (Old Yellow Enzyme family)
MSEGLGTLDNRVTPALPRLYRRWAEGGIGLSITGNVMIDRRALGEPGNVVLEDERDMPLLRAWASAGSMNGTALWMQLNHPGKQVPKGLNRESVAPSAVPFAPALARYFPTPRALREPEIVEIVERFGRTAQLAKEAGFQGVQIHGAHGYLVSQFLSPHQNLRDDAWGGSLEGRMRFVVEVYGSIRKAVGPAFPVGIKLNSADFQKGGFAEHEALEVVQKLAALGIDLVEISGGTYEAPVMAKGVKKRETTVRREAFFLEFAEKARGLTRVPLAVTGGFRSRAGIEAALAGGALDLVGLARSVAVEPDFPRKILGRADAVSLVREQRTGIGLVDRMAMMEILWYTRQLHRMGKGQEPKPHESVRWALFGALTSLSLGTLRTRMRA